ncbi:substrate-binding periplasmic protein [Yunchengibacter salinarum]|uniref:substrate-binding periplasmic protein n=1 Tax=Yunchengibacter salinarum TaxID=3133399 RepID=UPI0035B68CCC
MARSIGLALVFGLMASVGGARADTLYMGLAAQDYPPFYYRAEGRYEGAAVELARAAADRLGHELVFQRYNFARLQQLLRVGEVDGLILYFRSQDREKGAVYVDESHISETSSVFVRADADVAFDGDLSVLDGKRVARVRGYYHGAAFAEASEIDKQNVRDEEALIRAVLDGSVDAGVGNRPALMFHARLMEVADQLRFLTPVIDRAPDYIAFSPQLSGSQALAKDFTQAIRVIKQSPRYDAILEKYGFTPAEDAGG